VYVKHSFTDIDLYYEDYTDDEGVTGTGRSGNWTEVLGWCPSQTRAILIMMNDLTLLDGPKLLRLSLTCAKTASTFCRVGAVSSRSRNARSGI